MTDSIIKKLPYDLSSHAGLAFVGKYLKRININCLNDSAFPVRSGVANSDIQAEEILARQIAHRRGGCGHRYSLTAKHTHLMPGSRGRCSGSRVRGPASPGVVERRSQPSQGYVG